MRKLIEWLDSSIDDKKLKLAVNYAIENEEPIYIDSSFTRELVYNIEHAIHHMALIKVGLNEICPHVKVDSSYGVAVSTLRHQREVELVRN